MKLFDRYWIAIVMLFSIAAMPARALASSPTVIFSEIAWAGSSISSSDEWIELTNLTASSIDLSGWTLTGAGSAGAVLTLPTSSAIAPYSTFVISNYEYTHANSALALSSQYTTTTLSLPNSGFDLHLYNNAGAQIDVGGGSGAPFAGRSGGSAGVDDGRYRSMVRVDGLMAGSEKTAWMDAQTSMGIKQGVQDLGTPGIVEAWVAQALSAPVPAPTVTIPEVPPTQTPNTVLSVADALIINEFVVDPLEGNAEWIEIFNRSSMNVSLAGWNVEDATGKATALEPVDLAAGAFLVVKSPAGKLNNDADTILLRDPTGAVIDEVNYGADGLKAPKDGNALALDASGNFQVTSTTTPGGVNVIAVTAPPEPTPQETPVSILVAPEAPPVPEPTTAPAPTSVNSNASAPAAVATPSAGSSAPASSPSSSAVTAPVSPTTLRFLKLYPNTLGSDEAEEFIEVENFGSASVDLRAWKIEDASMDQFVFSTSQILAPRATITLPRTQTGLALNNKDETLKLITSNGSVIDTVTYGTAPNGETYKRSGSGWTWSGEDAPSQSAPAPATSSATSQVSTTQSIPSAPTAPGKQVVKTSTSSSSTRAVNYPAVSIANAKTLSDNARAQIEGTVIALPGTFGRQVMYLMDETGGIQVYFYDGSFPTLRLGQLVRVRGEMTTSRGERRVKISAASDIVPQEIDTTIAATNTTVIDLELIQVGTLVVVEGQVQSRAENKLVVEQDGATLTVYLKSDPAIDANRFERGDRVSVTGVLTLYDNEQRLRPRTDDDLVVKESAASVLGTSAMQGGIAQSQNRQSQMGTLLLLSVIVALGGYAVMRTLKRRRGLLPA